MKGITIKNRKTWTGLKESGVQADIYVDGEFFVQYYKCGDGSPDNWRWKESGDLRLRQQNRFHTIRMEYFKRYGTMFGKQRIIDICKICPWDFWNEKNPREVYTNKLSIQTAFDTNSVSFVRELLILDDAYKAYRRFKNIYGKELIDMSIATPNSTTSSLVITFIPNLKNKKHAVNVYRIFATKSDFIPT